MYVFLVARSKGLGWGGVDYCIVYNVINARKKKRKKKEIVDDVEWYDNYSPSLIMIRTSLRQERCVCVCVCCVCMEMETRTKKRVEKGVL